MHSNQQVLPNKQQITSFASTSTITSLNTNFSKPSKDQACKRVGSLKVDVKKIKSNIARSKR